MEQKKIDKIKQLHKDGKKIVEISRELKISIPTVYYYLDEEFKKRRLEKNVNWFKKLPMERKRVYYKQRAPYLREYKNKKYKTDENYRKKELERMKKYNLGKKEK